MNPKQNIIKTLVLIVILCGLGLYYRVHVREGGKRRQEAEEEAKKVFQIDRDKVGEFRLARANEEEIVCKKTDDRWLIEKPVQTDADQNAVNRVVSEFVDAKRTRTVEEAPDKLVPYGLDKPSLTLSAVVEERDEPATILFGEENPGKTAFYAKTAAEEPVFLVQSHTKRSLDKALFDLRDKKLADFQKDGVRALQLERGESKVDLEKRDDGTWIMTEPLKTRADATEIDKIIDKVQTGRIKEFVNEEPENLVQYGLDSPEIKLTLLVDDDRASKTLLIGRKNEDKEGYYAKRAEQTNVFVLEQDVVDALPEKVEILRDRSLLALNTGDVRKLQYVTEEEEFVLATNDEGAWELKKPVEEKADDLQVNDLITDLKNINANELLDEEKEEFGLTKPQITAKLWKKAEEAPIVVTIGTTDEEKNLVYARNMDGHPVAFDIGELAKVRKTLFDFRDKKLVSFNQTDVLRMAVRCAEHELVVVQKDDRWVPEKPEQFKIGNQGDVDGLVRAIAYVTMTEIVEEEKPENLADYGLDKPRAEFSVQLTGEESVGPFLIGDFRDNGVYVVTEGKPGVYLVEEILLDDMRRTLGAILNENLPPLLKPQEGQEPGPE